MNVGPIPSVGTTDLLSKASALKRAISNMLYTNLHATFHHWINLQMTVNISLFNAWIFGNIVETIQTFLMQYRSDALR